MYHRLTLLRHSPAQMNILATVTHMETPICPALVGTTTMAEHQHLAHWTALGPAQRTERG